MEVKPTVKMPCPNTSEKEWGSEIVTSSTPKKRKRAISPIIDSKDEEIIKKFEEGLEKSLSEKAAKINLNKVAVKSILKYVVTDEHVLAMMNKKENDEVSDIIPYEPKITRSKAKELSHSGSSLISMPWDNSILNSEVHELLTKDLHEDSSDDEYVPGGEESEEDSFSCSVSNPATPSTVNNSVIDDEEVFKTPQSPKVKCEQSLTPNRSNRTANIALRTRSKLSLSQTPLEKIEQSFEPPDIFTDMLEECKDHDWKNFLNSFNQPLEEVVKNTEDEEHDSEYNILSDEEITEVDKEELRADRAVRVPRRELNDLMAELFEYVDIYEKRKDFQAENLDINLHPNSFPLQQLELDRYIEIFDGTTNKEIGLNMENIPPILCPQLIYGQYQSEQNPLSNLFSKSQHKLFQQQMCQHVQMLTQNFILTFNHPFYNDYAYELKEYLLNFELLCDNQEHSSFNTMNLKPAIELITNWEEMFAKENEEAVEIIQHFQKVMDESICCFHDKKHYYLPFPDSILRIMSGSHVFMYPNLLPRIPFKHPDLHKNQYWSFSMSEYQLLALGLEQFVAFLRNDKQFLTRRKQISMARISEVIHSLLLPGRSVASIYRTILEKKNSNDLQNPVTFYFNEKRAPFTVHRVINLDKFGILPPKKRSKDLLPRQWRLYIYDETSKGSSNINPEYNSQLAIEKVPAKPIVYRKITPKGDITKTPEPKVTVSKGPRKTGKESVGELKKRFRRCLRSPIPYVKYVYLRKSLTFLTKRFFSERLNVHVDKSKQDYMTSLDMLPSMPCLEFLSVLQKDKLELDKQKLSGVTEEVEKSPIQSSDRDNISEVSKKENLNKDSIEASSTVKNAKKEQSLADKKKAKKRKEYLACIAMLTPPDTATEKDRREHFSLAYMEKLKETLGKKEFHELLQIFLNTDEKICDAVDLYRKLKPILIPQYQDLADEFLLFLTAEQACAVGQLIPFFIMNHMSKFLRNLELYFRDQPTQLKKVHKSLQDLNDTPEINLEKIKSTILPLLKGNPLLCDSFLQIFLEESPTASILNGAWDVIDVNKELIKAKNEDAFETLVVTEEDSACTCNCHKTDGDQPLKHHCNNCGLRFIQGKVYCQTSKGMKPVNVSFPLDPDIDHSARLAAPNKIRRMDPNSNKLLISPTKDIQEDGQSYVENDVDDRKRKVRVCRQTKKTTPKSKTCVVRDKCKGSPKEGEEKLTSSKSFSRKRLVSLKLTDSPDVKEPEKSIPITEDHWKNLPSPEYIGITLTDSDSSQEDDTILANIVDESLIKREENVDTDVPTNEESTEMETTVKEEIIEIEETVISEQVIDTWTREEDRIILETFKQNFHEEPISLIKQCLENRTENEIRLRFHKLMTLLEEMDNN